MESTTMAMPEDQPIELVNRLAAAIKDELRRQGVLYEDNDGAPDLTTLMMDTGAVADLTAVVRSALAAMK